MVLLYHHAQKLLWYTFLKSNCKNSTKKAANRKPGQNIFQLFDLSFLDLQSNTLRWDFVYCLPPLKSKCIHKRCTHFISLILITSPWRLCTQNITTNQKQTTKDEQAQQLEGQGNSPHLWDKLVTTCCTNLSAPTRTPFSYLSEAFAEKFKCASLNTPL